MPPTATQTVTRVNPEKFTVDSLFACQQISVWINFKTTTVIISLRQRCLQNEKHEPCRSLPLGWSVHRSRPSHLHQVFCRNVCWSSSRASSENVSVRMKQRRCCRSWSTRCTSPGDHENSDLYVLTDLQWCSSSPQAWYWWWAAILKFNKSDEVYNCLPRNKMQIKIQSWCNADGEVGRCFLHIITARQRLLKIPNWFQKT